MIAVPKISKGAIITQIVLYCMWAVLGGLVLIGGEKDDFLCFYIGGTLVREERFSELYSPTAQKEIQQRVAPKLTVQRPYPRPPWFALLIAPLTALPLARAYAVW